MAETQSNFCRNCGAPRSGGTYCPKCLTSYSKDWQKGLSALREINELPKILWVDEDVEKAVSGVYESGYGLLVATNKRLIFVDKGFSSLRVEDFPYDKITSIHYKTGRFFGDITIFVSGNKATMKNIPKGEVGSFTEYVRARTTAIHVSANPITSPPTQQPPALDIPEQIGKLAKLKEHGLLTEDEFQSKKQELLSRL
jgi:Bacterial PH domain/Short C-terminal domain